MSRRRPSEPNPRKRLAAARAHAEQVTADRRRAENVRAARARAADARARLTAARHRQLEHRADEARRNDRLARLQPDRNRLRAALAGELLQHVHDLDHTDLEWETP